MSFIDKIIGWLVPHSCLGCGQEGDIFCHNCLEALPPYPSCCYRCHTPSIGGETCQSCLPHGLSKVQAVTYYRGSAKQLIWSLKLAGNRSAAEIISEAMRPMVNIDYLVVPVPTATSRVRQRGYDQAKLMAKHLAVITNSSYMDCLKRTGQMHQHGLPRHTRLAQLAGAYRVTKTKRLRDAKILLIDDVLTTGATLEVAANVLRRAGAARVEAVVFARPDFITKNNTD